MKKPAFFAGLLTASLLMASARANIVIDYSFDTSGFFTGANAGRQVYLNTAANYVNSFVSATSLNAISPGGGNTWTLETFNPSSPSANLSVVDATISANEIRVYAGGSTSLGSGVLGLGGSGGYSAAGTTEFNANLGNRGSSVDMPWGGSISFDVGAAWYFDNDAFTIESFDGQIDFFSVAIHEITHLLGFGSSSSWYGLIDGDTFTGVNSVSVFGSPIQLASDFAHWEQGTTSTSITGAVLMEPSISENQRKFLTALDIAALQDIGFSTIPELSTSALVMSLAVSLLALRRKSRA